VITNNFRLIGNYPNPFNPTTTIVFELLAESDINLSIYNISGQLIKTMLSGQTSIGNHSVVWDARNQASGFYLLKLEVNNKSETSKLLLLK